MSKYESIFHDILGKIDSHELNAGDSLPSERELMGMYDASRDTIRKALNLLIQNGYIQKSKGRKSIVLDTKRFKMPFSNIESFKEVAKALEETTVVTEMVYLDCITPDERVKNALNIKGNTKVWMLQRVRRLSGEAVILDTDFLNADIVKGLTKEIVENSLYEYLEDVCGLNISYADKIITCQSITGLDEKLMDLNSYEMVVNIESYTYLDDNQIFQYTISRHRPDKFRFEDRARRMHSV